MDNRSEVREFLATRRARLTPQSVGLPVHGGRRRVPGLRREEVALLAGVSVDYYTQLERGRLGGASAAVLEALVHVLQLDESERAHLFDLRRAANTNTRHPHHPDGAQIRPAVRRIVEGMTTTPAFIRNTRLDIVSINRLGRALYSPLISSPVHGANRPVNLARFCFLDPQAGVFYPRWDDVAADTVALLRAETGRDPFDRNLSDLVGELTTRSNAFRTRWATHDVALHHNGTISYRHPHAGELELHFETMALAAGDGLTIKAFHAEPATLFHHAITAIGGVCESTDGASPRIHR